MKTYLAVVLMVGTAFGQDEVNRKLAATTIDPPQVKFVKMHPDKPCLFTYADGFRSIENCSIFDDVIQGVFMCKMKRIDEDHWQLVCEEVISPPVPKGKP